ncbi:MAG: Uma2 family endonuclease [Bacteroidota bacterium]
MAETIPIVESPPFDFSIKAYHKMIESGIIKPTDKVELIEGQIITMSPINSPHAACVRRLGSLLRRKLTDSVMISEQNPISLGTHSEPEPDIALLRFQEDFYEEAHPTEKDVFVAIEVSHTTQRYDRETKMPLYAQYNIPEAWVVDLVAKTIEVYAQPVNGKYTDKQTFKRTQVLTSQFVDRLLVSSVVR